MKGETLTHVPGYAVRAPETSESRAIADLIALVDAAEGAEPGYPERAIIEAWAWSSFDLAQDAWVVFSPDGTLVAYAELFDEGGQRTWFESIAAVHPDHRGRGIGASLLALYEKRARDLAAGDFQLWAFASAADEDGLKLLRDKGYTPKRQFWHMRIELAGRVFGPRTVPGVSFRGFDVDSDAHEMYEMMEAGFSEHWGYSPMSFADWSIVMRSAEFDPRLWFVAEAEGRIVGGAICVEGGRPFVRDVAVLKEWRGRGIGAALLELAFTEFARRGVPHVTLNVDAGNESGAMSLYERVGMRTIRRFIGSVKEVRA